MSIISKLFGRRGTAIPDILSRTEEGFADLVFAVVGRSKNTIGAWHFHIRAKHEDQVVGFEVVLSPEWKPRTIDLEGGGSITVFNGSVAFRTTGSESDLFIALLGRLYGGAKPAEMKPSVSFAATALGGNPAYVETQELKIKLFYESEDANEYAEAFVNIGFVEGIVELREKDGEYRQPLVRAIAVAV